MTEETETVDRPLDHEPPRELDGPRRLRVVFPRDLAAARALPRATVVVGRGPGDGGMALDHATVSRRHLAVGWDAARGGHVAYDLGSRNGSRIGGTDLRHGADAVPLADNDVLRVGDVLMVYEPVPADDAEPDDGVELAVPGASAVAGWLRGRVRAAAADPAPVVLLGATGTGKEHVAREIHRLSGRRGPLVAVNCAALSPSLVESQLFGHVRGAFTGAEAAAPGLFRSAHEGTLLLDEVGELPLALQPKLLRVLQEQEVMPVGASAPVPIDVRVVSATLRDLRGASLDGGFRLDLYARLSTWEIAVPPLAARRGDIVTWLEVLHRRWQRERPARRRPLLLEAGKLERVLLYDWPENLRGLDRAVHHACSTPVASVVDVPEGAFVPRKRPPPTVETATARPGAAHEDAGTPPLGTGRGASRIEGPGPAPAMAQPEREGLPPKPTAGELARVLADNDGSVRATAKHFRRDRRQIYRWMEQLGVERDTSE